MDSISAIYSGRWPFYPETLDIMDVGMVDYWENIAEQAVDFFYYKQDFMEWVFDTYESADHRQAAEGCWDLVKWMDDNDL